MTEEHNWNVETFTTAIRDALHFCDLVPVIYTTEFEIESHYRSPGVPDHMTTFKIKAKEGPAFNFRIRDYEKEEVEYDENDTTVKIGQLLREIDEKLSVEDVVKGTELAKISMSVTVLRGLVSRRKTEYLPRERGKLRNLGLRQLLFGGRARYEEKISNQEMSIRRESNYIQQDLSSQHEIKPHDYVGFAMNKIAEKYGFLMDFVKMGQKGNYGGGNYPARFSMWGSPTIDELIELFKVAKPEGRILELETGNRRAIVPYVGGAC